MCPTQPCMSLIFVRLAASDASGRVELILEGSVQLPRYVSQVELAFRLHPDYLNSTEQDDLGDSPLDPVRVCDLDNHSCQKATAARRCVALTDIHGTWDTFDVSFLSSVSGGPLRLQVELPGFNQQQPCYYLNTSEGPVLAIWKLPEQAHSVAEFFQVAHLQHLSRRNKRHLPPLPPPGRNEGQDTCRRVPWEVHFDADLGWDWVVRPKTYEASTCVGSCPIGLNGTVAISNHALLRIETKRLGLDTDLSLADACCVPTKMRSKVIWMYNRRGDYVVRSVDNMAVEECGCLWGEKDLTTVWLPVSEHGPSQHCGCLWRGTDLHNCAVVCAAARTFTTVSLSVTGHGPSQQCDCLWRGTDLHNSVIVCDVARTFTAVWLSVTWHGPSQQCACLCRGTDLHISVVVCDRARTFTAVWLSWRLDRARTFTPVWLSVTLHRPS